MRSKVCYAVRVKKNYFLVAVFLVAFFFGERVAFFAPVFFLAAISVAPIIEHLRTKKRLARGAQVRAGCFAADRTPAARQFFRASQRADVAIHTTELARTFEIGTVFARFRQDEFDFRG
jgi:hypothetical protein